MHTGIQIDTIGSIILLARDTENHHAVVDLATSVGDRRCWWCMSDTLFDVTFNFVMQIE